VTAPNSVSTALLGPPSSLATTVSGTDVVVSWSAGTGGTGYLVEGGTSASSSCAGVTFLALGTTTTLSYTDTGRTSSTASWFCYRVTTTRGSWTSSGNPTVSIDLGVFRVLTVSATNGGAAGMLDDGDLIVFTFSQAVNTATGPSGTDKVCSTNVAEIPFGVTQQAGACNANEATKLGLFTGGSSNRNGRFNAKWLWSAGNTILTVAIGTHTAGNFPTLTGTWTFHPTTDATMLLSALDGTHVCDTGALCLPTLTGGV
jgi:hypothetical protein